MPVARAGFRFCSPHVVASARKRKRIAQPARADANNSPALAGRPPYISANFKTLLDEIMHAPPPQLPKFSSAFNDLLARCLAKDPAARMSLSEVLKHPFWDVKFPPLSLPDQPLAASSGHAVDVLRLSRAMVCPPVVAWVHRRHPPLTRCRNCPQWHLPACAHAPLPLMPVQFHHPIHFSFRAFNAVCATGMRTPWRAAPSCQSHTSLAPSCRLTMNLTTQETLTRWLSPLTLIQRLIRTFTFLLPPLLLLEAYVPCSRVRTQRPSQGLTVQ